MWNNNKEIDLLEMLNKALIIFRRTWILLILLLAITETAAGAYVKFSYVAVYYDKVTFAVTREQNGESSYQYNKEATDELAVSFSSIVSSDVMKDAMCHDLGVEFLPATISAERIGTTNLFTVVSSGGNAEEVSKVIQAFLNNSARVFRVALMDINLLMIEEPEGAYIGNAPAYLDICSKVALVALALYCMFVMAYILLRRTVIEEEDIKQNFRLQCIAAMPYTKVVGRGGFPMISEDGSRYFDLKDAVSNIRRRI